VEHALEATARIETRPLGSELEASLLELELILRLRPDANRRSSTRAQLLPDADHR
jgi:hypothetical protein